MYSEGGRLTHGVSLRRPFHSLSRRHMRDGIQVNPPSTRATRSSGKRSKAPSMIRLFTCDWKRAAMPAYSSTKLVGHPEGVEGWPAAPP